MAALICFAIGISGIISGGRVGLIARIGVMLAGALGMFWTIDVLASLERWYSLSLGAKCWAIVFFGISSIGVVTLIILLLYVIASEHNK